jgi:hypothetical protein
MKIKTEPATGTIATFTALTFLSAATITFISCGGTNTEPDCGGTTAIRVTDSEGTEIYPVSVILDGADQGFAAVFCESAETVVESGSCNDGAAVAIRPATATLTAKASGFKTVHKDISREIRSSAFDNCSDLTLTMETLGDFESTDDYVTGFAASDTLDAFTNLSVNASTETGLVSVVKFYIDDLNGDPVVYFQNTRKHRLHYGFVQGVLGKALTETEYEATTYHGTDRTAMAGIVSFYQDFSPTDSRVGPVQRPLAIEFFPSDDLTPAQALRAYELIEERMQFLKIGGTDLRLVYVPASSDHEAVLAASDSLFERSGALWLSRNDLYGGITLQLLNTGIAYGNLRKMTPEQLMTSVVSFKDIILLTRLPNEVPLMGGCITEELQTPLAHVNVAARSRGTPNIALLGASEDSRVKPFIDSGTLVKFEVTKAGFTITETTQAEADAFWESKHPDDVEVPAADTTTEGLIDFKDLGFTDSTLVGAKAANLAECRAVLGDTVPDGFGVPFFYYQQFIDAAQVTASLCTDASADCVKEGRANVTCEKVRIKCADICAQASAEVGQPVLANYIQAFLDDPDFIQDSTYREASLDGIRYLFGHIPVDSAFATLIDSRAALKFGDVPIRLRSSTNAEDLADFAGAGLYESFSANQSDKLPSDRIRKVWASTWNWRAFEERAFMGLTHTDVKMGVAVHPAFPDELANGVLVTRNLLDPAIDGYYVNVQKGETSVTNPVDGALPEIFSVAFTGDGLKVIRSRFSSLSADKPLMTDDEIAALYDAARSLHNHFIKLYRGNPYTFALDIEFKLNSPDRKLVIKQARPYAFKP